MRRPRPLPAELQTGIFSREQALAAGLSPERLRRGDILRVGRGRYRWNGNVPGTPLGGREWIRHQQETLHELTPQTRTTRYPAAQLMLPGAVLSHTTAAWVRRWWLPRRFEIEPWVHLSRPPGRAATVREGVILHRVKLPSTDVTTLDDGRLVTTVERTWLDCAHLFSVDELTILGDCLVRIPYAWAAGEARPAPWTTLTGLRERVEGGRGVRGIGTARTALEQIRVGADSPKETELRLALIAGGLPEPQTQVQCWDPEYSSRFPATADLGYPQWRIAIHYEGRHHRSEEQLHRDIRREQAFTRQGWRNLRFDLNDTAQGFGTAVRQVRALISAAENA